MHAPLDNLVKAIQQWIDQKDIREFYSLEGWIKEELRQAQDFLKEME